MGLAGPYPVASDLSLRSDHWKGVHMAKDHPNDIGIIDVLKILGGIAAVILLLGIGCWAVVSTVSNTIQEEINKTEDQDDNTEGESGASLYRSSGTLEDFFRNQEDAC
jgi:hypothetical protein